jgi:hypothetical protein
VQRQNNKHGFGSGQFWPSPNGWAGSGLAPFKKKTQKNSKKTFLKKL